VCRAEGAPGGRCAGRKVCRAGGVPGGKCAGRKVRRAEGVPGGTAELHEHFSQDGHAQSQNLLFLYRDKY